MIKKSILALALSMALFSCNKDAEIVSKSSSSRDEAIIKTAENFIKTKYEFLESESNEADFDLLFATAEIANTLENNLEAEKADLNHVGIKYTSHSSDIKIISRNKISDEVEKIVIEETSIIKTNQISQTDGELISTSVKQRYEMTFALKNGTFVITEFHDLDKDLFETKKKESESQTLSLNDQNELTIMAEEFSKVTGTYNRNKAFTYAKTYAITPNPAYQDFSSSCSYCGGDCTNFLSQCLFAGGWPQIFGAASSGSSWWYGKSTNPVGYKTGFSTVWPSAQKMGFFLKASNRTTRVTSLATLKIGDAVMLMNTVGNAFHALIVTQVSTNGNLFLSCHTTNRFNAPMTTWGLTPTQNYAGKLPYATLWVIKDTF